MTTWQKIPYSGKGKKPPYWLEMRVGKTQTYYRVRYRAKGCQIQKTIEGFFRKWEDAVNIGDQLIASARFSEKKKPKNFITCAELCDDIIEMKKPKSHGTYLNTRHYFNFHIKPFLDRECPYASDLTGLIWIKYKTEYRKKYPERPLFEHHKFFTQLFRYAALKGLIPTTKLEFKEEKEDDRAEGQVIPNAHLQAFIANANETWKKRVVIQRLTGQRPGIIKDLKKSYVNRETGLTKIPKRISKNRRGYEFMMPKMAMNELEPLWDNGSEYFFPQRGNLKKPIEPNLKSWHEAWNRAGINENYTPHDIRHTFLTEKVNEPGTNLPVLCYSCDLSYKMLSKTYLHLKGEDTEQIAQVSNANAKKIFGEAL